jgi:flagellar motor protein MotB
MQNENPDKPESTDWLITYSDLMTLLLCLFVMLYAISTLHETEFESASLSLRGGFGLFGNQPLKMGTSSKYSAQNVEGIILFDWGSDDLTTEAKQELNDVYLQILGTTKPIQIIGYAELGEPSAYRRELDLAYARAVNVWEYLTSLGISREHCQIVQQPSETAGACVEIRCIR